MHPGTPFLLCTPHTLQLYIDKARLEEGQPGAFEALKNLYDVGDILGAAGSLRRTDKGELSVVVTRLTMLTKALLPLPDKWHGLADVEKRYRQRYLDLIVNEEARSTFRARSTVVSTIRRTLEQQGFLEVRGPGGGGGRKGAACSRGPGRAGDRRRMKTHTARGTWPTCCQGGSCDTWCMASAGTQPGHG
jgi:lysyl-tRNA synthetase class II